MAKGNPWLKSRTASRALRAFESTALALAIMVAIMVYANNRPSVATARPTLEHSYRSAISWLDANQDSLLSEPNPALWWMLVQANRLATDARLRSMVERYKQIWLRPGSGYRVWMPMFDRSSLLDIRDEQLLLMPAYNIHFLYGLTCDPNLGALDIVAAQNDDAYCSLWSVLYCRSHQLMALRWGLERGCSGMTRDVALHARQAVWFQQAIDFRVTDVYVERALLLSWESTKDYRYNSTWTSRILGHQLGDGSWSSNDWIIPVYPRRYLVLKPKGISVESPSGSFHTTALALLLLARLLSNVSGESTTPGPAADWASLDPVAD